MTFSEFIEQVKGQIADYLPEEYAEADITVLETIKNNDQKVNSLCIKRPEDRAVPNIYLNDFYRAHQEGLEMDEIFSSISRIYQEGMAESAQWQDFHLGDFESIKDLLYVVVLNQGSNQEYLKDIVHKDIPDTDITAVLRVLCDKENENGNASFIVQESMLEKWGVAGEDLFDLALKNTERLFPPKLQSVESLLFLHEDENILGEKLEPYEQYMFTNDVKVHGAAVMLYPGLLQKIGEATQGNFFILPSSIHETILIRDNGEMSAEEFQHMVMEVNRTHVMPEEVLSDEVYKYDFREQKLVMATDPVQTKAYLEQMAVEQECEDAMEDMEEAEFGEMEQ